jgi:hypothetical protein
MRSARAVALLVAMTAGAGACGGPAKEGGAGAACFRVTECQAGLVCVDHVCTNDLTSIDIHDEGGTGAGGAGGANVDDGGAGGAQGGAGGGTSGTGGSAVGGGGANPGGGAGSGGAGTDDASVE